MDDETTPRLGLALLQAGQAQKEWRHNEALAALDALVQPQVLAAGRDTPPDSAAPGDAWLVGEQPTGAWAGRPGALATWTAGGWRLTGPADGMRVWSAAERIDYRRVDGAWVGGEIRGRTLVIEGKAVVGARRAAIAAPAGGATVDEEGRAAIGAILAAMRGHGLISG